MCNHRLHKEIEMQKIDWQKEAHDVLNHVSEHMMEAHRGAMPWKKPGICVAFANDGAGEKQDREIHDLRDYLVDQEITELGFAKTEDGYSWVMLIKSGNPDQFIVPLWAGWMGVLPPRGDVFVGLQSSIAERVVAEHGIEPEFVAG